MKKCIAVFVTVAFCGCGSAEDSGGEYNQDSAIRYFFSNTPAPSKSLSVEFYEPVKDSMDADASILYSHIFECDHDKCIIGVGDEDETYLRQMVEQACTGYGDGEKKITRSVLVYFGSKKTYEDIAVVADTCVSKLIYLVNSNDGWSRVDN